MGQRVEWSAEEKEALKKLALEHPEKTYDYYARELEARFGRRFSPEVIRKKIKRDIPKTFNVKIETPIEYQQTTEIHSDGTHKSNKLIRMDAEQAKDVNYLLKAHGYDVNEWELVSARSNIWNTNNKDAGVETLYSSKIAVKPLDNGVNLADLIQVIKHLKSVVIVHKVKPIEKPIYLNIPLFDMHFGNSSITDYQKTQEILLAKLERAYKGVLFIIGQDLFHNDNFRGTTSKGTVIDKIDMVKAWQDAVTFYDPLIYKALINSQSVKVIYSKGNHDETVSWCFVKMLEARFPEAEYDTDFKERKATMLGNNFVGVCHSDKQSEKELVENFAVEYAMDFSRATSREVYIGHKHAEMTLDKGGVLIRRMPTRNKLDQYHEDHGYTKAHKRFQVYEYSENDIESITYV
jgi:hypothetical protein